ncbi:hypothetical protein KXZ74_25945, partial [Escherichia coli]|nr:hypothetical protein [Escherichia coli]
DRFSKNLLYICQGLGATTTFRTASKHPALIAMLSVLTGNVGIGSAKTCFIFVRVWGPQRHSERRANIPR